MRRTMMTGLALMALAVSAAGVARPARRRDPLHPEGPRHPRRDLSYGYAVNASGQVAGYRTPRAAATRSCRAPAAGRSKDLGTLGGCLQHRLCRQRLRPGRRSRTTAGGHATRSCRAPAAARSKDLGTLGGTSSDGYGRQRLRPGRRRCGHRERRAARVPVGPRRRPAQGPRHPRRDQQLRPWPSTPPARSPETRTPRAAPAHAFLSGPTAARSKDLGTLGGINSVGHAVNASGQVAGDSTPRAARTTRSCRAPTAARCRTSAPSAGLAARPMASTPPARSSEFVHRGGGAHAFLYSGGQMLDLNSLIAPGSGFTLVQHRASATPAISPAMGRRPTARRTRSC